MLASYRLLEAEGKKDSSQCKTDYIFTDSISHREPHISERFNSRPHLNSNTDMPSDCMNLGLSLCNTCHTLLMLQYDTIYGSGSKKILLYDFTNHKLSNCGQGLHLDFNIELQRLSIDKNLWNNFVAYRVTFTEKGLTLDCNCLEEYNKSDCAGKKKNRMAALLAMLSPRLIQWENRKKID